MMILALACCGPLSTSAADPAAKPKEEALPKAAMEACEEYVIPTPGELLVAAGKHSDLAAIRPAKSDLPDAASASDAELAYAIGIKLSDSYFALFARNKEQFLADGKVLLQLTKGLLGDTALAGSGGEIGGFASQEKWAEAFTLSDGFRRDLMLALTAEDSPEYKTLAAVSGWLRGLQTLSGHLAGAYQAETAGLLRQADLIRYMLERTAELPEGMITDPAGLAKSLEDLSGLLAVDKEAGFQQGKVGRIHESVSTALASLKPQPAPKKN